MRKAGLRPRWPRWPFTLAVVGVIIAGGAAAVVVWPHAWWWLVVVMAAAAVVVQPALAALRQIAQRRREVGRAARTGLQGITGASGSQLPSAGAADLEARVHQTVLPIPYIHRDEEDAIRSHLAGGRPVLLIGSSMVGKTKMAARIIAEEFTSWPVAIPDSSTALADLNRQNVTLRGSVIWLDDIDRLIGAGGITDGALRQLSAAGNILVGTIRAHAYDAFRPSDRLRLPEWDVLSVFEHIFISRDLSEREKALLVAAVDDPDIRERIETVGLGEYVGAAGQIAEALKLGAAGTDCLGYALVLAAADWRRCGMTRPIPASALTPLAMPHLDHRGQTRLANHDAFSAGMAWATNEINPHVSLLVPAGTDLYFVYDYALDLISAQDIPIPESSWLVIMDYADVFELGIIGFTAHSYHNTQIAIHAWRKVASSGHRYVAPWIAINLGALLSGQGDIEGAKDAYRKAINSGHPDAVPKVMYNLGVLLSDQGDIEGAKDAYRKTIDSGHPQMTPMAIFNLGVLLSKQGDIEGAKDAYRKAIDSGDGDIAPRAASNLGLLLERHGDIEGAIEAYRKAIDSGHPEMTPKVGVSLGPLLSDQGDIEGAIDAYRKAIDSADDDIAAEAAVSLGLLLSDQGDIEGAIDVYRKTTDSGHPDAAPAAAHNLGVLLSNQGDIEGAKDAYRKAIDSGHAKIAPWAAEKLKVLLK